jgi:hypothetical protein
MAASRANALGDDYHELIKHRLYDLADWLRETVPGAQTTRLVDTAPVMERELASRAGIGWVGKNTCVINPQVGSWLLLGQVLTTIDLPPDDAIEDACGYLHPLPRRLPDGAITAPYQLDGPPLHLLPSPSNTSKRTSPPNSSPGWATGSTSATSARRLPSQPQSAIVVRPRFRHRAGRLARSTGPRC